VVKTAPRPFLNYPCDRRTGDSI